MQSLMQAVAMQLARRGGQPLSSFRLETRRALLDSDHQQTLGGCLSVCRGFCCLPGKH